MKISLDLDYQLVIPLIVLHVLKAILYGVCVAFEHLAWQTVHSQFDTTCVAEFEIAKPTLIFMMVTYTAIIPDIVFATLGFVLFKLYRAPFSVGYNILMGLLCVINGYRFANHITCCTSLTQDIIYNGAILLAAAGTIHIALGVFTHFQFDPDDGYLHQAESLDDENILGT